MKPSPYRLISWQATSSNLPVRLCICCTLIQTWLRAKDSKIPKMLSWLHSSQKNSLFKKVSINFENPCSLHKNTIVSILAGGKRNWVILWSWHLVVATCTKVMVRVSAPHHRKSNRPARRPQRYYKSTTQLVRYQCWALISWLTD